MLWLHEKKRYWVLKKYPFFDIVIKQYPYGVCDLGYGFDRNLKFTDINDAKAYVERELYKVLSKLELNNISTLAELNKIKFIRATYNTWCNNHGDGKYIGDYKKYHWVDGRFLNTSSISNDYAIRYDRSVGEDEVKQHALKVVKRHIRRFLREYENS